MQKCWEYLSFDYYAYGFPFLRLWIPGVISILKSKDGLISKIIFSATIIVKLPFVLCASLYEEIQKLVCKDAPITPIRPIYFAGCYLITRAGAQKLLSVHDKILYIADRLPNVARKQNNLNFKIYTPLVVTQLKETFASNLSSIK